MGEIKSTLEIIMEKTKGLTMTDEDKREFKKREMAGKIKGIIQKFMDGIIDLDRLKAGAADIGKEDPDMVNRTIREELISRIRLEEDHGPILKILESTTGMDTAPIREILMRFKGRMEKEREQRMGGG